MNVYDFDGTIYDGDSTIDFYVFCIKKNPRVVLSMPRQVVGFVRYAQKKITKTELKEEFFSFFNYLENIDLLVTEFWKKHQSKIFGWYLDKKRETDVIISASPEFLLKPIADKLKVQMLIASKVDSKTGKYQGINCHSKEKVRRFYEVYGTGTQIDQFYSDSNSDIAMTRISNQSFKCKRGIICAWNDANI